MKRFILMIVGVALTAIPLSQALAERNNNPGIAPIQSSPHGASYGEWAAEWWKWAVGQRFGEHPLLDFIIPADCSLGQQGHVWFLGGTFAIVPGIERECTVPAGTALFFPIVNAAYFAFLDDPPEQRTEEYIRAQVACFDYEVFAQIDGDEVIQAINYFEQSPLFEAFLPEGNAFGLPSQILSPSADQGIYLFVRPLSVGVHTVEFLGTATCPFGDGFDTFTDGATYTITVVPSN